MDENKDNDEKLKCYHCKNEFYKDELFRDNSTKKEIYYCEECFNKKRENKQIKKILFWIFIIVLLIAILAIALTS